jgi:hypothetical protein
VWTACVAVVLLTGLAFAAPAATAPPPCETVRVSPGFARDRTLVCVLRQNSVDPEALAVSTDGGRSWQRPPAVGLVRPDGPAGIKVGTTFSPDFAKDRLLFATTFSGTFVSTDLGRTFTALDALVTDTQRGNPIAYTAGPPAALAPVTGPARRLYLAYAAGQTSARVDVALAAHEPVAGTSAGSTLRFIVPAVVTPDRPPLAFGNDVDPVSGKGAVVAFRCTEELACPEQLFTFPRGHVLGSSGTADVELLNDGQTILVTLNDAGTRDTQVWRSTDWGTTFTPWTSVNDVLAPVNRSSAMPPRAAIAFDPAHPRRAYLRVQGNRGAKGAWAANAPPAEQLFRSEDGGRSWRRIGFRLDSFQNGPDGRLPFNTPARGDRGAEITVAQDGRLLAVGAYDDGGSVFVTGVFCSLDGGAHWSNGCPR